MARNVNSGSMQYYRKISDDLMCLRSALEWVYGIIAAVLIFTCLFNALMYTAALNEYSSKGEQYSVIVSRNTDEIKKGDIVLLSCDEKCYCARVVKTDGSGSCVCIADKGNSRLEVSKDEIKGRVRCIFLPFSDFGKDAGRFC